MREPTMALELQVFRASSLIGAKVINMIGDELGSLEELVIELKSGCIAYAVVSCGSSLATDEKLFAIPWRTLAVDTVEKQFILDLSPEFLNQAPSFARDKWPDMTDRAWGTTVFNYYGCKPYWD